MRISAICFVYDEHSENFLVYGSLITRVENQAFCSGNSKNS